MTLTRVIIPDSHGAHIDPRAARVFLKDLKALDPDEVVYLGDHLDCGGTFNTHQLNYTIEMEEAYEDDVNAGNQFLDAVDTAAPRAKKKYLEGNHEAHVARWAARNARNKRDADFIADRLGPERALRLKDREVQYIRTDTRYQNLSVPGTIRLGRCFFTHGISHSKNADQVHLRRFGASVVFGHVHRSMSVVERTVTSDGIGAWCPGTLAKLQPLYRHTNPSEWTHGYGLQFVSPKSGYFTHINIPIFAASETSGLKMLLEGVLSRDGVSRAKARKRAA